MEELNVSTLFWLFTMGLLAGLVMRLVINTEGVSLEANIIWGVTASVILGTVFSILELAGGLLFTLISTLAVLFLVNIFHLHHEEDIYGHTDRELSIKSKKMKY